MVSRKRNREEMEAEEKPKEPSLLEKIRNMWEFASLMQYIHFFGEAVKIDGNLDIDVSGLPQACALRAHVCQQTALR